MAKTETIFIGVIGAGKCAKKLKDQAFAVGLAIAEEKAVLVNGGLKGVMEASAKGAKEADGMVVGIIPGNDRSEANPYCDVVIPSGLGEGRNLLVVQSSDVLISLHGKYGTISEVAFGLKHKKPIVSLFKWDVFPEVETVTDPYKAVRKAIKLVKDSRKKSG